MRERIPSLPLSCKEHYYRSCQKNHTYNNPSFTFVQTALSHFITNQTRMHSLLLLPSQGRVRKQKWRDWLTDCFAHLPPSQDVWGLRFSNRSQKKKKKPQRQTDIADLFGDGSGIREFLSNEISHSDVRHLQQLCKPTSVRALTDARTPKKHPLHSTSQLLQPRIRPWILLVLILLFSNRRRISQPRSLLLLLLYHLQAITPLGDSPTKSRDP